MKSPLQEEESQCSTGGLTPCCPPPAVPSAVISSPCCKSGAPRSPIFGGIPKESGLGHCAGAGSLRVRCKLKTTTLSCSGHVDLFGLRAKTTGNHWAWLLQERWASFLLWEMGDTSNLSPRNTEGMLQRGRLSHALRANMNKPLSLKDQRFLVFQRRAVFLSPRLLGGIL